MWAYIIGGICLFYFAGIVIFGGVGTNFYFIWGVLGAFFMLLGCLIRTGWMQRHVPIFLRRGCFVCVLLGAAMFVVVELLILSGFTAKGKEDLDYVIVLGAQIRKNGPSKILAMRLDKAYEYLAENENTVVIVSGGQGSNEPETEAACMKRYLENKGISPDRIIIEDRSKNTVQNLTYSKQLMEGHMQEQGMDGGDISVGIVSNNFHIFRAVGIAKQLGYTDACGIAAPSYLAMQPNNMVREFFGVMKDYLFGNM